MAFLESTDLCPLPRCQDLPDSAFGSLSASTMLVSLSHGWFFQCHPDPHNEQLEVLRAYFPQLRKRFPNRDILVFYDFLCSPQPAFLPNQNPRTKVQLAKFSRCMEMMHDVYACSDFIMHLEMALPRSPPVESFAFKTHAIIGGPSGYILGRFRGSVHVKQAPMPMLHMPSTLRLWDVVTSVNGFPVNEYTFEDIPCSEHAVEVIFHPPGFGKPNLIPMCERGWTFLERFVTMLKLATLADDDFNIPLERVMWSNRPAVGQRILAGAQLLAEAAKGQVKLNAVLMQFKKSLMKKRFSKEVNRCKTCPPGHLMKRIQSFEVKNRVAKHISAVAGAVLAELRAKVAGLKQTADEGVVDTQKAAYAPATKLKGDAAIVFSLMDGLVARFSDQWDNEREKQRTMSIRVVSMMLNWGYLSDAYIKRAEFDVPQTQVQMCADVANLMLLLLSPILMVQMVLGIPAYLFREPGNGIDNNVNIYAWIGFWEAIIMVALSAGSNYSNAQIPFGFHTCFHAALASCVMISINVGCVHVTGAPIPMGLAVTVIFGSLLLGCIMTSRCIRFRDDERLYSLGDWALFPPEQRFDEHLRAKIRSGRTLNVVLTLFSFLYALLGIGFQDASAPVQCAMVFAISLLHMGFELVASFSTSAMGADVMPPVHFFGVMAYKLCQCTMIANATSPTVVVLAISINMTETGHALGMLLIATTTQGSQSVMPTDSKANPEGFEDSTETTTMANDCSDELETNEPSLIVAHLKTATTALVTGLPHKTTGSPPLPQRNVRRAISRVDPYHGPPCQTGRRCSADIRRWSIGSIRMGRSTSSEVSIRAASILGLDQFLTSGGVLPRSPRRSTRSTSEASVMSPIRVASTLFGIQATEGDQSSRRTTRMFITGMAAELLHGNPKKCKQTSLYILVILLLRKIVEVFIPVQTALALTAAYVLDSKSSVLVSSWDRDTYVQAVTYVAINFSVECVLIVLLLTVFGRLFPQKEKKRRLLHGILTEHGPVLYIYSFYVWGIGLSVQWIWGGMDTSLQFEWLRCSNGTWSGGFRWDNCT